MILDSPQNLVWNDYRTFRQKNIILCMPKIYDPSSPDEVARIAQERVKRWYSMGKILIADFDGDGEVTQADFDLGSTTILASISNAPWITVCATGDINNDGVIDYYDWADFQDSWDHVNNGGTIRVGFDYVDFGVANEL
ncbi:MAG: hypothetical protein KGS45_00035 [Planctomycetes bacterium]|nr:hypothetical protein [Planctomycetota bacterium]